MKKIVTLLLLVSTSAFSNTTLNIFGPGGPAPAMKACALDFSKTHNINVEVTAGPTDKWITKVESADVFYSGSENMMDTFANVIPNLDKETIKTNYLRPSAILVRPKNPKKIKGIKDLVTRPLKVMVVNGAGQVAMWEDIVGGLKSVEALNNFRSNIAFAASNTGLAQSKWKEDPTIDAWLVFNIWGKVNLDNAQIVPTESNLTIYRSSGTALSKTSKNIDKAKEFVKYVISAECRKHFEAQGWF